MQNETTIGKHIFSEINKNLIDMQGKVIFQYLPVDTGEFTSTINASLEACHLKYDTVTKVLIKTDYYKKINSVIMEEWNNKWHDNQQKLKQIKSNVYSPNRALNYSRHNQVLLTRLRIDHTKITHQYLLNKEEQIICEMRKTPVTVEHILVRCLLYENERRTAGLTQNIKEILADNQNFQKMLNFINLCNLFDTLM